MGGGGGEGLFLEFLSSFPSFGFFLFLFFFLLCTDDKGNKTKNISNRRAPSSSSPPRPWASPATPSPTALSAAPAR